MPGHEAAAAPLACREVIRSKHAKHAELQALRAAHCPALCDCAAAVNVAGGQRECKPRAGSAAEVLAGPVSRDRTVIKPYYAARATNTIEAQAAGHPALIAPWGRKVLLGHALGKAGTWCRLCR
jgi:hypothetical protein